MTFNSKTLNDKAWHKIFEQEKILEKIDQTGFYKITAKQIKDISNREPRLMAKFDNKINLPAIYKKNNLSILPITRGSYIISSFNAYQDICISNSNVKNFSIPDYIESINYQSISSEASAINCAYISGIFNDFFEDDDIVPTLSGRMSSEEFNFTIQNLKTSNNLQICVKNSQIEIDGGFEGIKSLGIIEAKNKIADDFLIRQLYYPYRLWQNKISKKIRPVFMTFSNGIFSLYEFDWENPEIYNSLRLIKSERYSLEDTNIALEDIIEVFQSIKIQEEPRIPFPQANSFERIINLTELLNNNKMTTNEITLNYQFDVRQSGYYTNACRYLGLIEKEKINSKITYSLTEFGKQLLSLPYKQRQLELVKSILKNKVFYKAFESYIAHSNVPSKDFIIEVMEKSNLNIQGDTIPRRANSVLQWIQWIFSLVND